MSISRFQTPSMLRSFCYFVFTLCLTGTGLLKAEENNQENLVDEDWYQVEVVIFKYLNADKSVLRYEQKDLSTASHDKYNYLWGLGDTPLTDNQFALIDSAERELEESVQRMKRAKDIEVLQFFAWKQRLEREDTFYPIPIGAGKQTEELHELRGTIKLRRSRYVHIDVDLTLSQFTQLPFDDISRWLLETSSDEWPAEFLVSPLAYEHPGLLKEGYSLVPKNAYRLKQSRRIKEKEVHYLDHPLFGVIATFKEVDPPFRYGISADL